MALWLHRARAPKMSFSWLVILGMAVFLVLLTKLTLRMNPVVRKTSIGIGFLVAVVVGVSRLVLNSHSLSEVILGWMVGCSVALPTMYLLHRMTESSRARLSPWPIVVVFATLLTITIPRDGRPGLETHPLIVKMALWASGRSAPFHRNSLHERVSEAPQSPESSSATPTIY